MQVGVQNTPISTKQFFRSLLRAWPSVVGGPPNLNSILLLMAQSSIETGQWHDLRNYNLGNILHVPTDGFDFYLWGTHNRSFKSYESLDQAMRDYLRVLKKQFAVAWPAVGAGDPAAFAHLLKQANYYEESEETYLAGIQKYLDYFQKTLSMDRVAAWSSEPDVPVAPPPATSAWPAVVVGLTLLAGAAYAAVRVARV